MRSPRNPGEVLLLSVVPEAYAAQVSSMRAQGAQVSVAGEPEAALEMLRRGPHLVLVDLVHGPGVDRRVVNALNRARRALRVVAVHDGCLACYQDQVERLSVDGFWRIQDSTAGLPAIRKPEPYPSLILH